MSAINRRTKGLASLLIASTLLIQSNFIYCTLPAQASEAETGTAGGAMPGSSEFIPAPTDSSQSVAIAQTETAPAAAMEPATTVGNFKADGPLALANAAPIAAASTQESDAAPTLGTTENNSEEESKTVADAGSLGSVDNGRILLSSGATVTPDQAPSRVDDLTRQILLKEIELEKFNLNYTKEVAKQGRWKGLRYAFFQEANTGMGLAGAIISVGYRGARIHHANKVKPALQENANFIPMIGSIIGASAAAMEFGINGYHEIIAHKHGFSPEMAVKHVTAIKNDIDKLMVERDALLAIESSAPTLSGHAEIDAAEGRVLKDLRDQALQEFGRFHVGGRRSLAFQQAQYFFDFAKFTTNAIGYEFAYLSLHRHRRVWNGRGGVLFAVSGGLMMFGPILSRGFSKGWAELTKHSIKPLVGDAEGATVAKLDADLQTLNQLFKETRITPDATERAAGRQGLYGTHNKAFSDELRASAKQNAKGKLTATQNVGAGLYVGGTKVASGVLFIIPGFNSHYNNSSTRAGRVTNDLLFTASLIAIPSSAFAIFDTLRIQVEAELNRHKQLKAGTHPSQIVAKRLKELDAMEANLKSIH